MKRLVLLSWLFLCCTGASAQTQEPDPLSFFPHQVGDTWMYLYNQFSTEASIIVDIKVTDNDIYIYYNDYPDPVYKIDTAYNVFHFPLTLNYLRYKLSAQIGDIWTVTTFQDGWIKARVNNISTAFVLGQLIVIKEIAFFEGYLPDTTITENSSYHYTHIIGSGIGLIRQLGESGNVPIDLVGCIIDGDTLGIVTDVADRNTAPPVALRIAPNPCDVAATVQCALPAGVLSAHVEVSDVFGRVVYAAEMQGETCAIPTDSLAEGMYFCRVVAAQHTAVQMVCVQR